MIPPSNSSLIVPPIVSTPSNRLPNCPIAPLLAPTLIFATPIDPKQSRNAVCLSLSLLSLSLSLSVFLSLSLSLCLYLSLSLYHLSLYLLSLSLSFSLTDIFTR